MILTNYIRIEYTKQSPLGLCLHNTNIAPTVLYNYNKYD